MMRTGRADLPLHYGRAPRWLFARMAKLAGQITRLVVLEEGARGMLRRLSDPYWFQALGCVLGFDWHSSGLTTTTCGAVREGIRGDERDLGLYLAGGKGAASRATPHQIAAVGDELRTDPSHLQYCSRMAAKVDSAAIQDGYQIYHHVFAFDASGAWAVVQQGMSEETRMARRYHWLSEAIDDLVCQPHAAICCDARRPALNLVDRTSSSARDAVTAAARQRTTWVLHELQTASRLDLPQRHRILAEDIHPQRLHRTLVSAYEAQPGDFEALLGTQGVGARTVRALTLIAELVYGQRASFSDPARYSFAHGGKDGIPYPVDRDGYDQSIAIMRRAIRRAKLGGREERDALRRLAAAFSTERADASVRAPFGSATPGRGSPRRRTPDPAPPEHPGLFD